MRGLVGLDQRLDLDLQGQACPAGKGASTTRHVRVGPTRNRATGSAGRQVADSPTRHGSRLARAESRSSETARSAPRLVGTSAWTSSTIECSTVLPVLGPARWLSSSDRLSGVVIRRCGGLSRSLRRA